MAGGGDADADVEIDVEVDVEVGVAVNDWRASGGEPRGHLPLGFAFHSVAMSTAGISASPAST